MSVAFRLADLLPASIARTLPQETARLRVSGVACDSRATQPGDLFLALPGTRDDGRRYIADAAHRGAVAALVDNSLASNSHAGQTLAPSATSATLTGPDNLIPVVSVDAVRTVAGEVADRFFASPSAQLTLTGITGTNGKTTVALLLAQIIQSAGARCAVLGTLGRGFPEALCGSGLTTADVVANHRALAECAAAGARFAAMEVSSHALDQERAAGLRFAVAVFTNLTRDHLDYHGSMSQYQAAKARLFAWPSLLARVINRDDPAGRELLALDGAPAWSYAVDDTQADVHFTVLQQNAQGLSGGLYTPLGEIAVHSTLVGRFNAANLAGAVAAALVQGLEIADVERALPGLRAAPGRMERRVRDDGLLVVVDYAHTPDGLAKALQALREICRGRLWCVFGCGGDRDRGKRPLMAAVADQQADQVVLTDDNPRFEDPEQIFIDVLADLPAPRRGRWRTQHDRRAAIAEALHDASGDDIILIAGKGHEDYQDIAGVRRPFHDGAIVDKLFAGQHT